MTDYFQILKSISKEDYQNGHANLHIHSKYSDGSAEFLDIVKQAKEKGIKHFAITDHNTINGHLEYPNSGAIHAVEFDVWYKYIFLHLLAYGIDLNDKNMQKFYAKDKRGTEADIVRFFATRDIKNLIKSIHGAGGVAILAHPACCWTLNMDKFIKELKEIGLDGIEVYYPYPRWRKYIKFSNPDNLEIIADKYGLLKTGGTDCHEKEL